MVSTGTESESCRDRHRNIKTGNRVADTSNVQIGKMRDCAGGCWYLKVNLIN